MKLNLKKRKVSESESVDSAYEEEVSYAEWKALFVLKVTALLLIINIFLGYIFAAFFFSGVLTERELIVVTFMVAWTEANIEAFAIMYAWYQGKKVEPYTKRLADFISWSTLAVRLLKPVFRPIKEGLEKILHGMEKTPQERLIEELVKENEKLRNTVEELKRGKKGGEGKRKFLGFRF